MRTPNLTGQGKRERPWIETSTKARQRQCQRAREVHERKKTPGGFRGTTDFRRRGQILRLWFENILRDTILPQLSMLPFDF